MKISALSIHRSSLIMSVLIMLLPSCVAKKKFVEMQSYRNKAEQRVKELTDEVSDLQQEFNGYKNDFHYNNSSKDHYIDSLNKVIAGLHSDLLSTNENIDDQILSFQVEKRRLNQLLAEKDREIRIAQRNTDILSVQLNDIKKEITDLEIQLKNAESSSNSAVQKIDLKEAELVKLNIELQKKTGDLKKMQADLSAKNEQIESLKNQVNLLKKQIGQN